MTASKMWAFIVALVVAGAGLIGTVLYYREHPDGSRIAALVQPSPPKPPPAPASKPVHIPPMQPAPGSPTAAAPSNPAAKGEKPTDTAKAPEIAKEEAKPAKPEPPAGNGEPPHFDVVRVEPSGEAVLAGKGDPNSKVALMASGKVVAEAKADPSGNFVILPPPLKPGDHDLSLRETPEGKPPVESKQNVAVSVPKKPGEQVVVALAEPGKPTKLLSAPTEPKAGEPKSGESAATAPAGDAPKQAGRPENKSEESKVAVAKPETKIAPPTADIGLVIRSVELENGNGLYASGAAAPGTKVEVYLNGSHLAQVVAGPDRRWTVTVKKGLSAGHYAVRADALEGTAVAARVEVPFDVPTAMAEAAKPEAAPPTAEPAQPPPAPAEEKRVADSPAPAPAETAPAPAETPKAPEPQAKVAAGEPVPSETSKEPSIVPIPRPDVAARAKAAVAAAPAVAPPTLAAAPPAPAETRTAMPPAQTPVAPEKPATAPPTLSSEKPAVAPPTEPADVAAVTPQAAPATPPPDEAKGSEAANPPASASPTSGTSANAVIAEVETALVVRGDNLWNISRTKLGNPMRYTQIYTSNVAQIRNPNLIYPGQVFVMPQP